MPVKVKSLPQLQKESSTCVQLTLKTEDVTSPCCTSKSQSVVHNKYSTYSALYLRQCKNASTHQSRNLSWSLVRDASLSESQRVAASRAHRAGCCQEHSHAILPCRSNHRVAASSARRGQFCRGHSYVIMPAPKPVSGNSQHIHLSTMISPTKPHRYPTEKTMARPPTLLMSLVAQLPGAPSGRPLSGNVGQNLSAFHLSTPKHTDIPYNRVSTNNNISYD